MTHITQKLTWKHNRIPTQRPRGKSLHFCGSDGGVSTVIVETVLQVTVEATAAGECKMSAPHQ